MIKKKKRTPMFVTPLRKGLLALGAALCLLFVNFPVSAQESHIITFDVPRARTRSQGKATAPTLRVSTIWGDRAAHAGDPWDSVARRFFSRLLRPFLRLLPGRVRV